MLVGKLTYDSIKQRQKPKGDLSPKHVPLSSEFMSLKNNLNERPLKNNHQDLSFKGLSFSGDNKDKKKPRLPHSGLRMSSGCIAGVPGLCA